MPNFTTTFLQLLRVSQAMSSENMRLEDVFLIKAVTLDSKINAKQLRKLLTLENEKCFDSQLVDELVLYFGDHNTISFRNFEEIWSHLRLRRLDFDQFSKNGHLGLDDFQMLLEHITEKQLQSEFIHRLVNFYGRQITFDVFVHSVHHVDIITASDELLSPDILMEKFGESVRTNTKSAAIMNEIQPSAPPEEIVPRRYRSNHYRRANKLSFMLFSAR